VAAIDMEYVESVVWMLYGELGQNLPRVVVQEKDAAGKLF
jgi:hypothetical protein